MICKKISPRGVADFTKLTKNEALEKLFGLIETCLLEFPAWLNRLFHEFQKKKGKAIERFFNQELSACLQSKAWEREHFPFVTLKFKFCEIAKEDIPSF